VGIPSPIFAHIIVSCLIFGINNQSKIMYSCYVLLSIVQSISGYFLLGSTTVKLVGTNKIDDGNQSQNNEGATFQHRST